MTSPADDSQSREALDDYVLEQRLSGKSSRALARELHVTTKEIDASLDRSLPIIDTAAKARHIAADLLRLEALLKVFVKRACEDRDVPSGMLCVKLLERKSCLLGTDSPKQVDVVQIFDTPRKSSVDQIREAIERVSGQFIDGSINGSEPTDESKSDPAADPAADGSKPH
jgi:hypothetical protein